MTPTASLPPLPPTSSYWNQEQRQEGRKPQEGAEEGTTGVGLGWRRGRGLRFGCLTQKRLECKELIHSGVSLPQTKGQASRQRLREGERRVRDEGGWWLSYHLELLFWGRLEVGGGGVCWVEVDRGLPPPPPAADPRTPPPASECPRAAWPRQTPLS